MYATYIKMAISPYKIDKLLSLKIEQKVNEHARLYLLAIINEGEKDSPIYDTVDGSKIEILSPEAKDGIMFRGMVESVRIKHVKGIYQLEVQGVSNSRKLDVKLKDRSFQDKGETYRSIVTGIAKEYGGGLIDTASNSAATGKYIMQYRETDWEFIMRMASHFNAGLVPDIKSGSPNIYFGIPQGDSQGSLEKYNYSVEKQLYPYMRAKENGESGLLHLDRVYYTVETDRFFDIGDSVTYQDKTLFVNTATYKIENALVSNTYRFCTKRGMSQAQIYNEKITGLSVQGEVIATERDELKLHLCIDESQNVGKAHFFKYTTVYKAEGHSGWYCMPELGDTVLAYFPTEKEWEGVALHAIRTKGKKSDKINSPDVKYLRTKYGKEIMLSPDEVLVSCVDDDTYVRLRGKSGITVHSSNPIYIHSDSDMTLDSGTKIYMTAKKEITMTCKSSMIKMDGKVTIQGKEVRHN